MMKNFAHEDMKKSPPKVRYFSRISVISEFFIYCPELPMAQTEKFMFSNVAYKATVYRSGVDSIFCAAFFISITQPLWKHAKTYVSKNTLFLNLLVNTPTKFPNSKINHKKEDLMTQHTFIFNINII